MTTSERIRAAALGPAPKVAPWSIAMWVGDGDSFRAVRKYVAGACGWYSDGSSETERRMFLLFVSEAVK